MRDFILGCKAALTAQLMITGLIRQCKHTTLLIDREAAVRAKIYEGQISSVFWEKQLMKPDDYLLHLKLYKQN